jgi:hypothetical protein
LFLTLQRFEDFGLEAGVGGGRGYSTDVTSENTVLLSLAVKSLSSSFDDLNSFNPFFVSDFSRPMISTSCSH